MMKSLRERWRKTRSGSYRIPPGGYGKAQERLVFGQYLEAMLSEATPDNNEITIALR